jgi:hypothetical protein
MSWSPASLAPKRKVIALGTREYARNTMDVKDSYPRRSGNTVMTARFTSWCSFCHRRILSGKSKIQRRDGEWGASAVRPSDRPRVSSFSRLAGSTVVAPTSVLGTPQVVWGIPRFHARTSSAFGVHTRTQDGNRLLSMVGYRSRVHTAAVHSSGHPVPVRSPVNPVRSGVCCATCILCGRSFDCQTPPWPPRHRRHAVGHGHLGQQRCRCPRAPSSSGCQGSSCHYC